MEGKLRHNRKYHQRPSRELNPGYWQTRLSGVLPLSHQTSDVTSQLVWQFYPLWDKCEECVFLVQTKGRRERKRETKRRERRKGNEKGKGKLEVKLSQKRKKSQTPQLGIEPGAPANAADALLLSHRDKRHHQRQFVWNIIRSASTSQHRHRPVPTCSWLTHFTRGTRHGRHCASRMDWKNN